ncbi:MAG TPA: DNA internalization-related competence protein ComEC/Rec2 [Methylophilaceae bacterium]|nr:DNA internalization-related competence protein ComEC/Rec2 [Methylophilaceae bacterium]
MMIVVALGFVLGAWCLQQQSDLPSITILGVLALSVCLVGVVLYRHIQHMQKHVLIHQKFKYVTYFVMATFLGFAWAALFATYRLSDELPKGWEQKSITLVGVVASLPEATERGERFTFDVEKVLTAHAVVPHHISLNYYESFFQKSQPDTPITQRFHVGERWQLTVHLKRPHASYNPHGFDFEIWALSENIRATGTIRNKSGVRKLDDFVWRPSYIIDHVRALVGQRISQALTDKPYAGVIRALVIGDDSQILQEDWNVYLNTGTNHLMSISGLHITMLSGLAFALTAMVWRRFPVLVLKLPTRKAASVFGMITALLYAALAGFSVPTQRTLYMLMTVAVMLLLGRKLSFEKILSIALLVVLLFDPWAVTAAGFWLSFGAVAVIVYASGARLAPAHWLFSAVKVQWAVTLGLLPILVVLFGQISLVSPIANAFAIPLISFAVVPPAIFGSLLGIDSLIQLAQAVLSACMTALQWLAQLPFSTWQQQAPPAWAVLIALFGIVWHLLPKGVPLRWLSLVCVLPLFLLKTQPLAQGVLKVTVLDVGQGLAVVLQTTQHTLLYDTGSRFTAQSDAGNRVVIPYLRGEGIKKLDGMILSHDDIDHVGGAPSVLAMLPVDWMISSLGNQSELLQSAVFQAHTPLRYFHCFAGQTWVWDQVKFEVLHPAIESFENAEIKDNDRSCVLKVTSWYGSILIPGDAEKRAEYWMLEQDASILKSNVLVAPHHGSKTSSTQGFIEAVAPQYVIFTNGYLNRFGHPKPLIEQRYLQNHVQIYRSDYSGAVQMVFNQHQTPAVSAWRKAYPRYWHDQYPE